DSARRLPAQVNTSSVAQEVRRLEFINRSTRPVVLDPRVKRAAKENVARARTASSRSSNQVARLLELSTARDSRSAERKRRKKNHRRQDRNRSETIIDAAPERAVPEPFSLRQPDRHFESCDVAAFVSNAKRLAQAPLQQKSRTSAGDSGRYNNSAICTAFSAAPLSS